jgi:hypothetical protein
MPTAKTNRRRFLQVTAGLAVTTPYFWTSRSSRAESANDKFNVAAIGVGSRGGDRPSAGGLGNMVACADVHLGNANRFAERYKGKCEVYQDYRKLLDRKDIDAITCGTPDHWHTRIAIDAMRAGKDVYCEKPLTLTMQEGAQIMQVTRETGRVFQVGTQQRSENNHVFLKAVVIARSGRLGAQAARAQFGGRRDQRRPVPHRRAPGGTRLGPVVGPGAPGAVQPEPHRLELPLVAGILRRTGYRLGGPPHGHRPVGTGRRGDRAWSRRRRSKASATFRSAAN